MHSQKNPTIQPNNDFLEMVILKILKKIFGIYPSYSDSNDNLVPPIFIRVVMNQHPDESGLTFGW